MIRFNGLAVKWRIILPVFAAFIILLLMGLWGVLALGRSTAEGNLLLTCREIVVSAEAARAEATASFSRDHARPLEHLSGGKLHGAIPFLMSIKVGARVADQAGMELRPMRLNPRNAANAPDDVGTAVLEELERGNALEKIVRDRDRIRYFRPVRVTRDCLLCHGEPAGSRDPFGGAREGWKEGDLAGAMEVTASIDALRGARAGGPGMLALFALIAAFAFGTALYLAVDRAVSGESATTRTEKNADTASGMIVNQTSVDAGNIHADSVSPVVKAPLPGGSVEDVVRVSQKLNSETEQIGNRSRSAAATADKLSLGLSSVTSAAGELSRNVNTVAVSAEKMTSTVNEIARNTEKASRITAEAVEFVGAATKRVGQLGKAADEISMVTEAIVEVAEQTKLLALNATIEAARAGEAGKGFAVVANEVKELAKQTNLATDDIRAKIEAMQSSSESTVSEIEGIRKIINEVNDIVVNIASAVEKQSETALEIASNIGRTAAGIRDMTGNVSQTAEESKNIADEIKAVTAAGEQLSKISRELERSASLLGETIVDKMFPVETPGDHS